MESQSKPVFQTTRSASHGDPTARRLSRRWVPIITIATILVAVASASYSLSRPSIPDEIEGLIFYSNLESGAVEGTVTYDQTPPAGGAHTATSLECGIYFNPIADEQAVAALATGAIWVAYDPAISDEELEDLKLFGEGERDVFMAPYPDLPHPAIITAWGVQLYPDSPTDTRIASFIRDYKNADSAPYPDLPCHAEERVP